MFEDVGKIHPIELLAKRFPQMYLPIKEGENKTEEYKNAVLRGGSVDYTLGFSMSPEDSYERVTTPAGDAEVFFVSSREDFEHCIRALAHRCEPAAIPESMGASTISGLINWEKIRAHEDDLDSFLADKSNYLDTVIILSGGPYSAVPADTMGLTRDEWTEKSVTIRKYHELTHFVSRKLFPENKDSIRDEIIADMDGIISAFGYYDTAAARLFLGTEGSSYRPGGRLQNYIGDGNIEEIVKKSNSLIDLFYGIVDNMNASNVFDILAYIEKNKIGIYTTEA